MLDSDLAALYQVETKVFNQAVKRNIARFPEAFHFRLTDAEYDDLRSKIVTSNGRGGRRYLPNVFTEQGLAMLSAVLHSDIAIKMSIQIMMEFVQMRKYLVNGSLLQEQINDIDWKQQEYEKKTNERFGQVFDYIAEHEEIKQRVFFDGQIYDAFMLLVQHCINIGDLNIRYLCQCGVVISRQCHRIAFFLRLALTQISNI